MADIRTKGIQAARKSSRPALCSMAESRCWIARPVPTCRFETGTSSWRPYVGDIFVPQIKELSECRLFAFARLQDRFFPAFLVNNMKS